MIYIFFPLSTIYILQIKYLKVKSYFVTAFSSASCYWWPWFLIYWSIVNHITSYIGSTVIKWFLPRNCHIISFNWVEYNAAVWLCGYIWINIFGKREKKSIFANLPQCKIKTCYTFVSYSLKKGILTWQFLVKLIYETKSSHKLNQKEILTWQFLVKLVYETKTSYNLNTKGIFALLIKLVLETRSSTYKVKISPSTVTWSEYTFEPTEFVKERL